MMKSIWMFGICIVYCSLYTYSETVGAFQSDSQQQFLRYRNYLQQLNHELDDITDEYLDQLHTKVQALTPRATDTDVQKRILDTIKIDFDQLMAKIRPLVAQKRIQIHNLNKRVDRQLAPFDITLQELLVLPDMRGYSFESSQKMLRILQQHMQRIQKIYLSVANFVRDLAFLSNQINAYNITGLKAALRMLDNDIQYLAQSEKQMRKKNIQRVKIAPDDFGALLQKFKAHLESLQRLL